MGSENEITLTPDGIFKLKGEQLQQSLSNRCQHNKALTCLPAGFDIGKAVSGRLGEICVLFRSAGMTISSS